MFFDLLWVVFRSECRYTPMRNLPENFYTDHRVIVLFVFRLRTLLVETRDEGEKTKNILTK